MLTAAFDPNSAVVGGGAGFALALVALGVVVWAGEWLTRSIRNRRRTDWATRRHAIERANRAPLVQPLPSLGGPLRFQIVDARKPGPQEIDADPFDLDDITAPSGATNRMGVRHVDTRSN